MCRRAWIAASQPASCPAQTWSEPTESITSCLRNLATVLPMILRRVSPIPMGRSPGFLSNGIRRFASKGSRVFSPWTFEHSLFVSLAIDEHKSEDSEPKLVEVRILRHQSPSKPDGPAPSLVFKADSRIIFKLMASKRTSCAFIGVSGKRTLSETSFPCGCFCSKSHSVSSFNGSIPFSMFRDKSLITLPFVIFFTNCSEILFVERALFDRLSWLWVVSPSNRSSLRFPCSHREFKLPYLRWFSLKISEKRNQIFL